VSTELTKELRRIRKAAGMSQMDMATRVGVSLLTIQLWERGISQPNAENAEKLEQTLKELNKGAADAKN
jgi:transcriptional regulator with XRE-family HTH domain